MSISSGTPPWCLPPRQDSIHAALIVPNPAIQVTAKTATTMPRARDTWVSAMEMSITAWDDFNLENLYEAYGDILRRQCPAPLPILSPVIVRSGAAEIKNLGWNLLIHPLQAPLEEGARGLESRLGMGGHLHNICKGFDPPVPVIDCLSRVSLRPSHAFYHDEQDRHFLALSCIRRADAWRSNVPDGPSVVPFQQLATYAKHGRTRYGFMVTDEEVVVARTALKESDSKSYRVEYCAVPWTNSGAGVLTARLAIWFLVMMSLNRQHREVQPWLDTLPLTLPPTSPLTLPLNVWFVTRNGQGELVYRHPPSLREMSRRPRGARELRET